MQTFYARTRRIVAALLIPALVVYAALALTGSLEAPVAAATIIAIVPLRRRHVETTTRPRHPGVPHRGHLCRSVLGGSDFGAGYLDVPPAIGFATMALTLRTEASVARTEGRL
jgi:hypothetical protein